MERSAPDQKSITHGGTRVGLGRIYAGLLRTSKQHGWPSQSTIVPMLVLASPNEVR